MHRPPPAASISLILCALLVCAAGAPAALDAQTAGDARAFRSLSQSSIGALTPLVTPAMLGRRLSGAQLGLRYGLASEAGVRTNAFAASALFAPNLSTSVTLTAGVLDRDCGSCAPALLLGAGADARVYEGGEVAGAGTALTVALSGDIAFAQLKPGDDKALALAIGIPVTLTLPSGGRDALHISPYFTPLFGMGETTADCPAALACEKNGTRWLLGGGVGIWNPMTNISASLGMSQIMLEGAPPVYGVNVVIGGR